MAGSADFATHVDVAIIGSGACGLVAALAASDAGATPLVIERDPLPSGSTALSSGMIPACGTRWQSARSVVDSAALMAGDIQAKAANRANPAIVARVCELSGPTLEWLADRHAIEFELVEGFLYPGHSVARMHAPAQRTGAMLQGALLNAAQRAGIDAINSAEVTTVFADVDGRVRGIELKRPDGQCEQLGCDQLILACNGYGGNPDLVAKYIPEMCEAMYFGHTGNQGDALRWGEQLHAAVAHLGAYQGHGAVAVPEQILITWAMMMAGGVQLNQLGERFSNEHQGYSEQAVAVLAQPEAVAWCVYDQRIHELGLQFDDYRRAVELGAIKSATDEVRLAELLQLPVAALTSSIDETRSGIRDRFGRDFATTPQLVAPYYAVRVTGALFHTQGGLIIDTDARVLRPDQSPLPNVFAGGGAACGVSGPEVTGYLSGNGLLTAVVLGRIAGESAARG